MDFPHSQRERTGSPTTLITNLIDTFKNTYVQIVLVLFKKFKHFEVVLMSFDLDFWDPFSRRKRFGSFFDDFLPSDFFEPVERLHPLKLMREPLIDVIDKGSHLEVLAELPGVDKKDIKINVLENSVSIEAEKKSVIEEEDKKKGHFYSERSYSKFFRKIPLGVKVIPDKSIAELHDGLLKLKLEKLKPNINKSKSFKVEVK